MRTAACSQVSPCPLEPVMDGDDGDPMSSSLVDARHRAVYEYGKAYQSMIDKFMSMRTAQVLL